jgi:hypothetical protein
MIKTYTSGFYNSVVKNRGANPITLAMVKSSLRIDDDYTSEDDTLIRLINVATQLASDYINADILVTETTLGVFEFAGKTLNVEDGNYISASGLTITGTTMDFDVYESITGFRVEFDNYINMAASVFLDTDLNLVLHYFTGFPVMPDEICQAILVKIADLFDMERNGYITNQYRNNDVFGTLLQFHKKW